MDQKITPNLWFNGNAKEAVDYYVSVFKDAKVISPEYYPQTAEEGLADFQQDLAGDVLTIEFELLGTRFTAINANEGGFTFNESVSFSVPCKDQAEIDYYWNSLTTDGGEESMCGWVKDKCGVSWQIAPMAALGRTLSGPDAAGRGRAMEAMMKMHKLVIADLEKAYAGK